MTAELIFQGCKLRRSHLAKSWFVLEFQGGDIC